MTTLLSGEGERGGQEEYADDNNDDERKRIGIGKNKLEEKRPKKWEEEEGKQ